MKEYCVDASVIIKLAIREPYRAVSYRLVRESVAAGIVLIAPPFFESEVDSVIRKRVMSGQLSQADARKAYRALDRAPVQTVTHPMMRQRAREIAEQFNLPTVYDAAYTALAELRGCEFWTADKRFYDTVRSSLKFVKYLPNYP